jgi:hypothetical protein
MVHKFYKDNNKWYIDLPLSFGIFHKDELEMVMGADTMLDILSNNGNEIELIVSETKSDDISNNLVELFLLKECCSNESGAYYIIFEYENELLDLSVWLYDITKVIFGYFPKVIYIYKK